MPGQDPASVTLRPEIRYPLRGSGGGGGGNRDETGDGEMEEKGGGGEWLMESWRRIGRERMGIGELVEEMGRGNGGWKEEREGVRKGGN